ncbi:hypothetical protein [Microbacterium sp. 69-10]|uniref:hypothetical protein n=1 Tax=Microbacterium sp. 69-10 TaxID=1895783 RepID=UPI0025D5BC8B|nr:hypothetical protein [Microbacterium sp. 69-10]
MRRPIPLPDGLGARFRVRDAVDAGATLTHLRRAGLDAPFWGIRSIPVDPDLSELDPFARQAAERRMKARAFIPRLGDGQFYSHETAAALLGGPLPLRWLAPGVAADGRDLDVHVSSFGEGPIPRANGIHGHRANVACRFFVARDGAQIARPETAWAQLGGSLSVIDLVTLGDFFCRMWREGYGRRDAGTPPLTTIDRLRSTMNGVRWRGIRRLREAIELVREDSWSPRESAVRFHLVTAGLPEPALNVDVFDDFGLFLGCVDMAYPDQKVAVEYHGELHHAQYAADVERMAALRAAGWTIIEVTSALFARPEELVARVRIALRGR